MKLKHAPLVALLATSVAACDFSSTPQDLEKPKQRDVYTSLEDCVADWGDTELCERQIDKARERAATAVASHSGGVPAIIPIFYGPSYYDGNRSYVSPKTGSSITPATQKAAQAAAFTRPGTPPVFRSVSPVAAPVSAVASGARSSVSSSSSSSVSRGGFGSTGHAAASSSSGG